MNETRGIQPVGLRDYFAAQAIAALVHHPEFQWNVHEIAENAYRIADAMLEARKHPHKAIEE